MYTHVFEKFLFSLSLSPLRYINLFSRSVRYTIRRSIFFLIDNQVCISTRIWGEGKTNSFCRCVNIRVVTFSSAQAPLYTCRAYVFQVDPDTRKSWNQLSTDAGRRPTARIAFPLVLFRSVNVQIFHDSVKNAYRIISVDGAKILVNTTITGRMSFSKTSPKFCQWVDVKANQVYGLGFADEIDLSRVSRPTRESRDAIVHSLCSSSIKLT